VQFFILEALSCLALIEVEMGLDISVPYLMEFGAIVE